MGNTQEGYEINEVRRVIADSTCWSEALTKLGRNPRGGVEKALKRFVSEHGISTDHFTGKNSSNNGQKLSDEEFFSKGTYRNTSVLKMRVLSSRKIPYQCAVCGMDPEWMESELVLWLDHIDGDPKNNQLDNLRFACPNCASQMSTHGNKKVKKSKKNPVTKSNAKSEAYTYVQSGKSRLANRDCVVIDGNTIVRDRLAQCIAQSMTLSDVVRICKGKTTPSNIRKVSRYAHAWGISIEHFDPYHQGQRHNLMTKEKLDKRLAKGTQVGSNKLKHWLWEFKLLDRQCQKCAMEAEWQGVHISLHLDHINGENTDNRLENLRILCPNCHSQTRTFAGGRGDGPKDDRLPKNRDCARCGKEFWSGLKKYCSDECRRAGFLAKTEGFRKASRGQPKPQSRKVERPPLAEVRAYVEEHSYVAAGRKWGVSDNAIRKWLRSGIQ